jgi:hypothetical protein
MRPLPLLLFLCLTAGSAHAETWRILNWDRFSLIAVDAEHRRTTSQKHPAVPVLDITLYPGADSAEARVSEQEVDCADQRVRERSSQMYFNGKKLALDDEIQVWRDPGEERDRLLVRAVCRSDGLDDAPAVQAEQVTEAMAAHLAAATAPKSLEAMPAWASAWRTFSTRGVPDAVPYIEEASRQEQHFWVSAIGEDGGVFLLADAFRKVAERRYRFHTAYLGPHAEPTTAAVWSLREADCGQKSLRMLAWVGFDAEGKKTFGYDVNTVGVPFELAQPGTVDADLLRDVCATAQARNRKASVNADLRGAIAAYQFYFYGRGRRPDEPGHDAGWRAAYLAACSAGCLPSLP